MANIEKMIASTFMEIAQGLETGSFGKRPKIALTGMGSEHGEENSMAAAIEAAKDGIDVYYIGTLEAEGVTTVKVANDEEGHDKMEEMLKNKEVDAAVTMHFPFPIGVSTVGRCVTPATAKEIFSATFEEYPVSSETVHSIKQACHQSRFSLKAFFFAHIPHKFDETSDPNSCWIHTPPAKVCYF